MPITNKYKRVKLELILVKEDRQRRTVEVEDLIPSIAKRGVVHPIIVEDLTVDGNVRYGLIAGERRFRASQQLKLPDIPCRMVEDLTETERQILELEENVKRKDLPWKDEVSAVARIHKLYSDSEEGWTQEKTADAIGMTGGTLSIMLAVAKELQSGNQNVAASATYRQAYNFIARRDGRIADDAMNDLLAPAPTPEPEPEVPAEPVPSDKGTPTLPRVTTIARLPAQPDSILNEDFCKWVTQYSGQPFSLVHIDFPYGIGHDKSDQGGSAVHGTYDDSDENYWKLCTCFADNIDRIMMQSSHLMFWTSTNVIRQAQTLSFFKQHPKGASLEFIPVPLTWHKTDNKGILPDPKRGPRYVGEACFMASRGDRHIIKAVSNIYGAPTVKDNHQSEKPEPMLRHFMAMFVDENTRMLDPTCGSGSSLRAAESLGAKAVLGLEIDTEFADAARIALRKFRNLRALEKKA